jgi:hypothetical protein
MVTDVSGQHISPSSRVKQSKRKSSWTAVLLRIETTYQRGVTSLRREGLNYTAAEVRNLASTRVVVAHYSGIIV